MTWMTMLRQWLGMLFFVLDLILCFVWQFLFVAGWEILGLTWLRQRVSSKLIFMKHVCEGIGQYMRVLLHEHKDLDLQSKGLYLAC